MTTKEQNKIDVLQQAFDDFKTIYATIKNNDVADVLQYACELFVKAYQQNNIGLCKALLKTLTDYDRRQALKYIAYVGLALTYNITTDDLQVREYKDFDGVDNVATFKEYLNEQRKITVENNRQELINDLTKYKTKATKQVATIFNKLTEEQKKIFKAIVNKY